MHVARALSAGLLLTGMALAADPLTPARLDIARHLRARFQLTLKSTFSASDRDHRLRHMFDEAHIDAKLGLAPGETRGAYTLVTARALTLSVTRRKTARVAGLFSDTAQDARACAALLPGRDPPPPWQMLVSAQGAAVADAATLTSASARWPLEAWLHEHDRGVDEEARMRRLSHYLELPTLLGVPELPAGSPTRFQATLPIVAGESGLTNKLCHLVATYDLETSAAPPGRLRITGPLVGLALTKGHGRGTKRVDQWIEGGFSRGEVTFSGELVATFDPAAKKWCAVRVTTNLAVSSKFDGGAGRATFERELRVELD
jgi:hypothetical protein